MEPWKENVVNQLTVVKQLMYFISGLPSRDPCIWSLPRSLRFYHGSHTQYAHPSLIISYNFLANDQETLKGDSCVYLEDH